MAITAWSDKPQLGQLVFKKAVGEIVNGYTLTTEIGIPYTSCDVVEAQNNTYPGVANVSAGAVNSTRGKKLVSMSCVAPAHSSWFLQKTINDWIGGTAGFLAATTFDTSTWDFDRYEPVLGHQRYTGGKLQGISVSYNAAGGPINVGMQWLAIYPAEEGAPATFATPTRVTGRDYDTGDVTSSSLDLLRSFTWTAGRAQAPQPIADNTYFFTAITSHSLGGTLSVEQSPTASQGNQVAVAANTVVGTIVFQVGPVTTGVKFTNYVKRDSARRGSPGNAPGTLFVDYSLEDEGNVSTTGYPFQIVIGA